MALTGWSLPKIKRIIKICSKKKELKKSNKKVFFFVPKRPAESITRFSKTVSVKQKSSQPQLYSDIFRMTNFHTLYL